MNSQAVGVCKLFQLNWTIDSFNQIDIVLFETD